MRMRVLILGGSGKIGSAAAFDLVRDEDVESVGIAGRSSAALEDVRARIKGNMPDDQDKLESHVLDTRDEGQLKDLMKGHDVGIIALPDRKSSYAAVEAAIGSGLDVVDVLEEYHRRPDPYETEGLKVPQKMTPEEYGDSLHRRALDAGITLLDGMGFAPGLSNITLADGINRVDARSAVARVGGIPSRCSACNYPFKYMVTWSLAHVLREYMVKVRVVRDGRIVEVDATSEREEFRFKEFGQDEIFECAITPGMPSFPYTRPCLQSFSEKTIRWPGHWQSVDALKASGILNLDPVQFDGGKIVPREFFISVVEPRLLPRKGDTDVCVMWNTATGERDGQELRADYYMWAEADVENGISAMSRVTGFTAAAGARFLGRGMIDEKGIVPPEDAIAGDLYSRLMRELRDRSIRVFDITSMKPSNV